MDVKEILLKNISENKFFDICNFIEELYLKECDILILMARKFFNLFCVFHELNCQKYKRLEIPYLREKKIITNRALPLIKKSLQDHQLKKVIIADDIIIHGRSIREVYEEVINLCPEAEILLMSYMRNGQEDFAYLDITERVQSRYLVKTYDEWREFSDEIINIFYMSGRPYISYLPYFSLNIEWKRLMEKMNYGDYYSIQDKDMKKYGVEAYMYTGKKLEIFQRLKCCEIPVLRFYYYSKIEKVIAIPYFCMNEMEEESLVKISDYIRTAYFTQKYQELVNQNDGANEMRMMELEYALSSWLCMHVLDLFEIQAFTWHKEIEYYNFCEMLLPEEIISDIEIQHRLSDMESSSNQVCVTRSNLDKDTQILLEKYHKLKEIYNTNFPRWKKMRSWIGSSEDYKQRFLDNYLVVNGGIDEQRCKNNNIEQKRLFGISVSYLLEDMANFLYKLYGGEKSKTDCLNQVFAVILKAIDSGKGTIVIKAIGEDAQNRYSESVIYAGEQNYKFYENTNFPIMYGLYLIEQESRRQKAFEKINVRKRKLVDDFARYLEQKNIFYIKEEMQQIAQCDVCGNYKKFLQNSYEKYYGNFVLDKAVTMAMYICSSTQD